MALSFITPHYNDFEGLQQLYGCLKLQTNVHWEWLVVDDFSESHVIEVVKKWFYDLEDQRVHLICNTTKTNASVCRNLGAEKAQYEHLVFLDADDTISEDFVLNRDITFKEFAVYKNRAVIDKNGTQENKPSIHTNFLNCFLKAQFIWQTTAILWKKAFFIEIGAFDPNLQRLQDVELSIRALFVGQEYTIIDNEVDFFYSAKPISSKPDIVKKSCASVNYLIIKIYSNYSLEAQQQALIKSYYFACVKALQRCKNRKDVRYVKESLKVFYSKKYINTFEYMVGKVLLLLYKYHLITDALFMKMNRYFFKEI